MNKHIVFQAVLGGCVGALTASGLYSVAYATMDQGASGWLRGTLAIAGASFVLFVLLFLLELTFWRTLRSARGHTKPLP